MSEGIMSLTDTSVEVSQRRDFERKPVKAFRPKEGQTYRLHFMTMDVLMRSRHYNPIKKKYYRCLQHEGYCPVCVEASKKGSKLRRASDTFGANVLVYDVDDNGQVKTPVNAEVYFWAFGSDKFVSLRNIIQEWGPLTDLDIIVNCTDAQFQKLTFQPARKCLYKESGPEFQAACDKKFKEDSYPLDKFLCKEVPLLQLCEDFGISVDSLPADIKVQLSNKEIAQDRASVSNSGGAFQEKSQSAARPALVDVPEENTSDFKSLNDISTLL